MPSDRFDPEKALTSNGGSRAEINKPTDATEEPEQAGQVAERVLDDLAARQQAAMDRLRRQKPALRPKEPKR